MNNIISDKDKAILRDLAKTQLQYANEPRNLSNIKKWYLNNDLKEKNPPIHIELGTFYGDVVPDLLKCEGEFARSIEASLYCNFVNYSLFEDDYVVPDFYGCSYHGGFNLFGIDITRQEATDTHGGNLGHHFNHIIFDLHDDFNKLKKSTYSVDREKTQENLEFFTELFQDVLPVKLIGGCLGVCPTQKIVHMMGMENMFFSFNDYPDEFKQMMDMAANDSIEYFEWLGKENLILPTTDRVGLGQGSLCFTNDLPNNTNRALTSKDVWGYMDSQETVGVSVDTFEEFIYPAYKRIADTFGLLSYGCCEPVDPFWEKCISNFTNLRKVSISPWCNEEYMGEQLSNRKVIFHRKPFPNFIGVGTTLDEDAVREHIKRTCLAAKNCFLEFSQRDVYSINKDINKVKRYVQIIREEIEKHYFGN